MLKNHFRSNKQFCLQTFLCRFRHHNKHFSISSFCGNLDFVQKSFITSTATSKHEGPMHFLNFSGSNTFILLILSFWVKFGSCDRQRNSNSDRRISFANQIGLAYLKTLTGTHTTALSGLLPRFLIRERVEKESEARRNALLQKIKARRGARWPLDHHHGPNKASLITMSFHQTSDQTSLSMF